MGSIDIPPFLRQKMKERIQNGKQSSDTNTSSDNIPPFLKKKDETVSPTTSDDSQNGMPNTVPSQSSSGSAAAEIGKAANDNQQPEAAPVLTTDFTKGFQQQPISKKPALYDVAQMAKKQNDDENVLIAAAIPNNFPANGQPSPIQQNQAASKEKDVLSGNPDAVTSVIQKQQSYLQSSIVNLNNRYGDSKNIPNVYLKYKAELDDIQKQTADALNTGVQALNSIYADKFQASPDKSANVQTSLGEQLRQQKAKIGADLTYADEQTDLTTKKKVPAPPGIILLPDSQTQPVAKVASDNIKLSDPINNQIIKEGQEFEFTNRSTLLNAVGQQQKDQVDNLMQMPVVQQYINGTDEQRKQLENDPTVQQAKQAHSDLLNTSTQHDNLINQYPQVKAEADAATVANTFANYIVKARKGEFGGLEQMLSQRDAITGTALNDEYEIKRVAELSGLPEDVVRQHAKDASIPSYLGLATRGFGDVIKETEQGLNRLTMSKADADIQNKLIEDTKYHTPTALQLGTGNINPDAILSTMFSTVGQVAAYGLEAYLGGEVLGGASGLTRLGSLAKTDLATLNVAEQILPANRLAGLMVKMGVADTEGEALGQIVNATAKAKNIGGTYSSAYATSYEAAYQEAAKYTADEAKRKQYADSQATANGLAMVVLNPANIAAKTLDKVLPQTVVGDYLKTGAAIEPKVLLKNRLEKIGETLGLGVTQSLIPVINESIAKSDIFNYHTSSSEFFKQALNASMNMAIGILPLGILGAAKEPTSDYLKSSLFQVGEQPDLMKSNIEDSFNKGEFTNDEKNRQISIINTLSDLVKNTPDKNNEGKTLTQSEKNNLVYLQLQNGALRQKQEVATPEVQEHYEQEINDNKTAIKDVMTPPKMEPKAEEPNVAVPEVTKEDNITVGDMIDKTGSYKGEKGSFYQDGQTVVFKVAGKPKEYELGNIDEVKDTPINKFGITHEESVVGANDNGDLTVRGKTFKNNFSDPISAINVDKEGNVVSVNLESENGEKRTFRGNIAEDLAYQIHLKEINKNNETRSAFEQHINTDEAAKTEIDNAGLPEVAEGNPTESNEPVSRQKVEPNQAEPEAVTKLKSERDAAIEAAHKPELSLTYMKPKELANAEDTVGVKQRHDEIREKFNNLKDIADCLWP